RSAPTRSTRSKTSFPTSSARRSSRASTMPSSPTCARRRTSSTADRTFQGDVRMIRLTRVGKRFGSEPALRDVNLEVGQGELCVVLGPSGAGKTTLFRLIAMEDLPTEGQVQVGSFVSGRLSRGERA